ncbi:AMP-dependent synthetase and ligase [Cyanobacterium stanieri PCC 7202]|uniref:AMP-dependent synthetase and ligase n=1 Tax=Cyanobacterium stanieri (strain ATCC 29140 / PCC 7202) TaxID=292563 RepID=K9YNM4_CYASC|nr:AMP-dependent synthetase and ligase [Cyanobacterium stanieri PCC 7202]
MILDQLKIFENNCTYNNQHISLEIKYYINKIIKRENQQNRIIFLSTNNPQQFISVFFASIITKSSIFLLNPHWQQEELQQVYKLVKPDFLFSDHLEKTYYNPPHNHSYQGIMIPTGGTSGNIKFAIHTWETLNASAKGFSQFWQRRKINFFCCLPLYHVSGLMQIVRTFVTGGSLAIYDYSLLKKEIQNHNYDNFFISLVPTQLNFLLENFPDWLKKFETVLVGGSATPKTLLQNCYRQKINLALTYGMTETASGVTILKPENFFKGINNSGHLLPHSQIVIKKNQAKFGQIIIKSDSLFKGYYPHYKNSNYFLTDDLGYFDQDNFLHIVGRNSQKIISGGENVYPCEIENVVIKTGLVKDIVVVGKNDHYWGQIICAVYVAISGYDTEYLVNNIKAKLRSHLSHYKIPKLWLKVDQIPRNPQGKIDYGYLEKMLTMDNSS